MDPNLKNVFFSAEKCMPFQEIVNNNDLEELLYVQCATQAPVPTIEQKEKTKCTNPLVVPRKVPVKIDTKVKVKSIAKIRNKFELDHVENLREILKRSEDIINLCLRKKSREQPNSKTLLKNLLRHPLSRSSWKKLLTFNLNEFSHSQQTVSFNGKCITLSGSMGGNTSNINIKSNSACTKIIKPASLSTENIPYVNKINIRMSTKANTKPRGILSCSNVSFKPGPLSRKPSLSKCSGNSLGPLELVKVPSVGIEVFPRVGVKLDSAACYHLSKLRQQDECMDKNWAQFATSLVEQDNTSKETESHTFVLPFEHNQKRILMQKDLDFTEKIVLPSEYHNRTPIQNFNCENDLHNINSLSAKDNVDLEVKKVLRDLINTISIGEVQDRIWEYDEDYNPVEDISIENMCKVVKKKSKKRKFCELKRLDVTVIDVNNGEKEEAELCDKEYCILGCVCSSLRTCFIMNEHCGNWECMLDCSCRLEVSKSAVVNLQHHMNRHLAKEEKKFKRTVICSNDETIVMGACRRGQRIPKKYEDFYFGNQEFKEIKATPPRELKVVLSKLPSHLKLEPWCMVHKLYKCFCKGLFTEGIEFQYSYATLPEPTNDEKFIDLEKDLTIDDSEKECNKINVAKKPEESLESFNCQRTEENVHLLKRSKKCVLKYKERNSRLRRLEIEEGSENHKIMLDKMNTAAITFKTQSKKPIPKKILTSKLVRIPKSVSNTSIHQKNIIYSWTKFLADYACGNLFVWAAQKALKIYVTMKPKILSTSVCIPIPYGSPINSQLVDSHQPILKNIINMDKNAHKLIAFLNKTFAWELLGPAKEKKYIHLEKIQSTIAKIDESSKTADPSKPLSPKASNSKENIILNKNKQLELPNTSDAPIQQKADKPSLKPNKSLLKSVVLKTRRQNIVKTDSLLETQLTNFSKISNDTAAPINHTNVHLHETVPTEDIVDYINHTIVHLSETVSTIDDTVVHSNDKVAPIKDTIVPVKEKMLDPQILKKISTSINTQLKEKAEENKTVDGKCIAQPKKNNIPTLKISSKQLIKLPPCVTAPFITEKYRWFLLYIEDELTGLTVLRKKFKISRHEIFEAMMLAEKEGKTCKYSCQEKSSSTPLSFGMYALPKNNLKNIFMGPYKLNEINGIKFQVTTKTPPSGKRTWGIWTKPLNDPNIIEIDSNNLNGRENSVNKTRTSDLSSPVQNNSSKLTANHKSEILVIEPSSLIHIGQTHSDIIGKSPNKNVSTPTGHSILQATPPDTHKSIFGRESPNKKPCNPSSKPAIPSPKHEKEEDEDDVIFLPTNTEIFEISDSEDDDHQSDKPTQVWFVCQNIPLLGYIGAMQSKNGSVTLKFDNLGPIECSDPSTAIVSINMIIKNYVGFEPSSLSCSWSFVKSAENLQGKKPLDERKLNKFHVITQNGLVHRAKALNKRNSTKKTISRQ